MCMIDRIRDFGIGLIQRIARPKIFAPRSNSAN